MNRVAIAFLTKDRVALSRRTIEPLVDGQHALFWIDGSSTAEGQEFQLEGGRPCTQIIQNVCGGADAAIVYALTKLLEGGNKYQGRLGSFVEPYTHVGLCENDVLLAPGWFAQTMALFERGREEGLNVGAASPRCYEDRILIQRDGYAVMHNLGAGIVIFTREAARLILDFYRSTWSTDNRHIFCQLSGIDIGPTWAFRGNQQWLTADWGFDAILARAGLASLAACPPQAGEPLVEMVGQIPSLAEQGLTLAHQPVDHLCNEHAFEFYRRRLNDVWIGNADISTAPPIYRDVLGNFTIFPHQMQRLNGIYAGDWRLKWTQGFGPFSWVATSPGDSLTVPLAGHCELLVSGGSPAFGGRSDGAQVEIVDDHSGFSCSPVLVPEGSNTQIMTIPVPANVSYREVRLTALSPGATFYGIRTREPQMLYNGSRFDHTMLPPAYSPTAGERG